MVSRGDVFKGKNETFTLDLMLLLLINKIGSADFKCDCFKYASISLLPGFFSYPLSRNRLTDRNSRALALSCLPSLLSTD